MRRPRLRVRKERLQPRYRGLAHTVGPREIGLRGALCELLDSLLPLVAGQSRRAPKTHAAGLGTDTAVAGTSNDQCPLELRKMLGLDKPVPQHSEFDRMSDADLINELAKQANELGVQIDLSYKFGEGD